MKSQLIAPCGMNCGICLAYLREKNKCPGCRAMDKDQPITRVTCRIKACKIRKEKTKFCIQCIDSPCDRLKNLDKRYRLKYHMSMIENLEYIKKSGIRKFLLKEKKKWTCPTCGGTICVHRGICLDCKKIREPKMDLSAFGWDTFFENKFAQFSEKKLLPARVTEANRLVYKLVSEKGELMGKLSGKFRHSCQSRGDYPTVGDWVAYKPNLQKGFVSIQGLVERKSRFSRKAAGKTSEEQVIAANVDVVFIVSGLDQDHNIRRLERYVTLASEGNAEYVFILNKADLRKDVEELTTEIKSLFGTVPVYAISALQDLGLEEITKHITTGKTVVFLGSSGAGKSTIINRLLGEEKQKTGHVSYHDGRGRHITTSKNLIVLPNGAIVIDTPGLRELSMLCTGEGLKNAFSDIEEYAKECKYRTCTHTNEPGCAVKEAVKEGKISEGRVGNYRKLRKEIAYNLTKHDARYRTKGSRFWKNVSTLRKEIKKTRQ